MFPLEIRMLVLLLKSKLKEDIVNFVIAPECYVKGRKKFEIVGPNVCRVNKCLEIVIHGIFRYQAWICTCRNSKQLLAPPSLKS